MKKITPTASTPISLNEVQGASELVVTAVQGVTTLVEQMHSAIVNLAPALGKSSSESYQTRGITKLVYRSVRGITGFVGYTISRSLSGLQASLKQPVVASALELSAALSPSLRQLKTSLASASSTPYRDSFIAALNGVLGDNLASTNNPLTIAMQFRDHHQEGSEIKVSGKVLVLIHGLCMHDQHWLRNGQDHGATLAKERGFYPLYLHYNTGLSIQDNGAELAQRLESTLADWQVPIEELVILGHSMGGLLARSCLLNGLQLKQVWAKHLSKIITLGTPHSGAPLERAGRGVDWILGLSPYTAPLAKLGQIRSMGIQNLYDGQICSEDSTLKQTSWPRRIQFYAIAATKQQNKTAEKDSGIGSFKRLIGDGLVPVSSALALDLAGTPGLPNQIPITRQKIIFSTDHFELLSSDKVIAQLLKWIPV